MKYLLLGLSLVASACWSRPDRFQNGWLIFSNPDTTAIVVYESWSWGSQGDFQLRLERDSTYTVTAVVDSTVVRSGRWTLRGDSLCITVQLGAWDCSPRVTRNWLHDRNEVTGHRMWRENPFNELWPPRDSTDA